MINLLLVEDNLVSQKMMYYTFKREGLETAIASTGEEAVGMAAATNYDVILMDIMMPGIDGYKATQLIREREEAVGGQKALIIGLTGNVYDSEAQKCREAGMDAYMPKPFDMLLFKQILSENNISL